LLVMDMLVAVLNCCTKEELDELEDELPDSATTESGEPVQTAEEILERRKVIKNKILAVGRMSRVFALLREESERVSELKSISGSTKLPYGTLALGAEGIKEAITGFDDAYVNLTKSGSGILNFLHSRRSDIENERLPPDLVDPESEEGKALFSGSASIPSTPHLDTDGTAPPGSVATPGALSLHLSDLATTPDSVSPATPASPITPLSPAMPGAFRGHRRQQSLGTTKTSPSTRRRSIEGTMALIKEVADGHDPADNEWEKLADNLAGKPADGTDTPPVKA
jgi:serine/threonine-protein phosphatase 2B catalytic subunit